MSVEKITQYILKGNLTDRDYKQIVDAIKQAREERARSSGHTFKKGDKVQWPRGPAGRSTGTFDKYTKNGECFVDTRNGAYRLPADILSPL